jgi:hypothetical protein
MAKILPNIINIFINFSVVLFKNMKLKIRSTQGDGMEVRR